MYEYIVTAFKVIVGLITNDRLAIAAAVALGVMFLWVTFSLIFSFQAKFARGVRKINTYVSRNGIYGNAKLGLEDLISKMPGEFQRGYKAFERNPKTLPSENIKRFESLDVELSGGVFNQNKSVLKTYMNLVFITLLLLSFAILQDATLTGYLVAEAFITPAIFLLVAKVVYYVYTAIRQNQYKTAVEDFNEMLDNLDNASMQVNEIVDKSNDVGEEIKVVEPISEEVETQYVPVVDIEREPEKEEQEIKELEVEEIKEQDAGSKEDIISEEDEVKKIVQEFLGDEAEEDSEVFEDVETSMEEESALVEEVEVLEEENKEVETVEETTIEEDDNGLDEISAIQEYKAFVARAEMEAEKGLEDTKEDVEETETVEEDSIVSTEEDIFEESAVEEVEEQEEQEAEENGADYDNFKPDFSRLLEEEQVEVKRGRGRPKKEVKEDGEFVIKNDKEFEDALVRAEKLMRKNEEPLSASQTKRIEKQIKELVDAMTKYKEGK